MKLTKYEHACLVIQNQGKKLVIDPGEVSLSFNPNEIYDYVVITHEHADHLAPSTLKTIYQKNPSVHFYVDQAIYEQHLKPFSPKYTVINDGVVANPEAFELAFYGHDHAIIYQNVPCANSGVLVNKTLYYPGDSLTIPTDVKVQLLAVPAAAPWLKTSEAMDFVKAIAPKKAFLTHDIMLSDTGHAFTASWIGQACTSIGAELMILQLGTEYDI